MLRVRVKRVPSSSYQVEVTMRFFAGWTFTQHVFVSLFATSGRTEDDLQA